MKFEFVKRSHDYWGGKELNMCFCGNGLRTFIYKYFKYFNLENKNKFVFDVRLKNPRKKGFRKIKRYNKHSIFCFYFLLYERQQIFHSDVVPKEFWLKILDAK